MKYAMPVHPKILEQDYKTELSILFNIPTITKKLKEIDSIKKPDEHMLLLLRMLNKFLNKTWYSINLRKGINLKNRELLVPLFKQMNRLFANGDQFYSGTLYRGVRLSRMLGPTDLSDTYPNSMDSAKVLKHLESLAYGLRSWTRDGDMAKNWAKGIADEDTESAEGRDLVVFEIRNPEIILDADKVIEYYFRSKQRNLIYLGRMFDVGEVVVNLKNPRIVDITTNKRSPWEAKIYHVVVEDMG
jgi:hypothetical protein